MWGVYRTDERTLLPSLYIYIYPLSLYIYVYISLSNWGGAFEAAFFFPPPLFFSVTSSSFVYGRSRSLTLSLSIYIYSMMCVEKIHIQISELDVPFLCKVEYRVRNVSRIHVHLSVSQSVHSAGRPSGSVDRSAH